MYQITQEELEREKTVHELKRESSESQLKSEKYELAERLKEMTSSLKVQEEGWTKERSRTLKLTFSKLKLSTKLISMAYDKSSNCR